jgi:hypothetical protein
LDLKLKEGNFFDKNEIVLFKKTSLITVIQKRINYVENTYIIRTDKKKFKDIVFNFLKNILCLDIKDFYI